MVCVRDYARSDETLSEIPGALQWQNTGLGVKLVGAVGFLGMLQPTSGPKLAIGKYALQGEHLDGTDCLEAKQGFII